MGETPTKHVNRVTGGREASISPTLQEEFDACRGKERRPLVIDGVSGKRRLGKRMQGVVARHGVSLVSRARP